MRFENVCASAIFGPEQQLSIHDDPPGLWARVAVVCGWDNAVATRQRWPHASVVGPCRAVGGVELVLRNLLANPQIRSIVWDGPDRSVDGAALSLFRALWFDEAREAWLGEGGKPLAADVVEAFSRVAGGWDYTEVSSAIETFDHDLVLPTDDEDRLGGRIVLPPPPPVATAPAPHGDPGERVTGDLLSDVWAEVLFRAMRFGREVPTQYGPTRELLNLVAVVRKPEESLRELEEDSETCRECIVAHAAAEIGHDHVAPVFDSIGRGGRWVVLRLERLRDGSLGWHPAKRCATKDEADAWVDEHGHRLLPKDCGTCGGTTSVYKPHPVLGFTFKAVLAYHEELTGSKWQEGSSYNYGPRMHGFDISVDQFEAIKSLLTTSPGSRAAYLTPWRPAEDSGKESGRPCLVGVQFRAAPLAELRHKLHMTLHFRSHDLFQGWPSNVAGACVWLVEWARELGMDVGTLTCVSGSAHVYGKDWSAALAKVEKHRPRGIRWDQRSSWRIEVVTKSCQECGGTGTILEYEHDECLDCGGTGKVRTGLRAVCMTADGNEVVDVIERESPRHLLQAIERSGLVTEIGHAMFLAQEVDRIWRSS